MVFIILLRKFRKINLEFLFGKMNLKKLHNFESIFHKLPLKKKILSLQLSFFTFYKYNTVSQGFKHNITHKIGNDPKLDSTPLLKIRGNKVIHC